MTTQGKYVIIINKYTLALIDWGIKKGRLTMEKDFNMSLEIVTSEFITSKDTEDDTASSKVDDSITKASLISYLIS